MSSQRKRHQRPHLPAEIEQYEEETYPRGLGIVELAVAAVACILVLLAAGYYLAQGGKRCSLDQRRGGRLGLAGGHMGQRDYHPCSSRARVGWPRHGRDDRAGGPLSDGLSSQATQVA